MHDNVDRRSEDTRASKFDEYGNIRFNDEKARLDNYAIQLQNDPNARGAIIAYGGRRGRRGEAQARANRARDYLVNTRGIDAGRIDTIDGGYRDELTVELWVVPAGATAPTASPTVQESEVQFTRGRAAPRRRESPLTGGLTLARRFERDGLSESGRLQCDASPARFEINPGARWGNRSKRRASTAAAGVAPHQLLAPMTFEALFSVGQFSRAHKIGGPAGRCRRE